jgi:hypothetical protein
LPASSAAKPWVILGQNLPIDYIALPEPTPRVRAKFGGQHGLMIELPFASYCNRFPGGTGWVVGRGPTRFEYAALGQAEGPFFFINDAVGQERWIGADQPAFFFAHDASMECWLFGDKLRSIPVLITDQPITGPRERRSRGLISGVDDPRLSGLRQAIFYRKNGPLDRPTLLSRRREEIQRSGQLHTASGTIHPLLHFAWYVGCSKLKFVGCDGLPEVGYDSRLENRSNSTQQNALFIRIHQERMLRQLSVQSEYVGAPPHRIKMLVEIAVGLGSRARFLDWTESLVSLLRTHGCADVAVVDKGETTQRCWIGGVWPAVEPCVECFVSQRYRELAQDELRQVLGDPKAGPKVAFQAVP